MFLRRLTSDRPRGIPPMILVGTGLFLIGLSLIWPQATVLHSSMSPGGVDLIQGFLLGIAIACEVLGIGRILGGKANKNTTSRD